MLANHTDAGRRLQSTIRELEMVRRNITSLEADLMLCRASERHLVQLKNQLANRVDSVQQRNLGNQIVRDRDTKCDPIPSWMINTDIALD